MRIDLIQQIQLLELPYHKKEPSILQILWEITWWYLVDILIAITRWNLAMTINSTFSILGVMYGSVIVY